MKNKSLEYNSPIDQEFRYVHTSNLPYLLEQLGISLFISTYQAGKLMVVRAHQSKLITLLRNFQQVMGIAVTPQHLAVGTLNQIWSFDNVPQVASQIEPINHYDACFVPRLSHVTGNIQVHELAWIQEELWIVNTRFSCLSTLATHASFVPRWQPPFITALTAEDRCHLNGLALVDNQPRYVTALGTTNTPQGWRSHKTMGGCVMDVPSNEIISKGLCMPHSPRWYQEKLWLLDSGTGRLLVIDPNTGKAETVVELPGFARGLAFYDQYAFIGLSQIREKQTFGGLPIEEKYENLHCGIWIIDLHTGQTVSFLEFQEGCTELFDLQILSTSRTPTVLGFQREDINNVFILKDDI